MKGFRYGCVWGLVLFTLSAGAVVPDASRFFSAKGKIFHVYVVDRNLTQREGVYRQEPTQINLALVLYHQYEKRLQLKGCTAKPKLFETPRIAFDKADVIIVIRSTWISSSREYYASQRNAKFYDIEVDYQLYIPRVYGSAPVADYAVRQTLSSKQFTAKSVTKEFSDRLSQLYAWQSNDRLLDYLNGDMTQKSFIRGRLTLHPDDDVAVKLSTLSKNAL